MTHDLFAGGGEMGALMRAFDWGATPLGPPETWSQTLRVMTRMLLSNSFPILLWWGPDFIQLYNDAYVPVLGEKHPQRSLGQPFRECWSEVWPVVGPLAEVPFNGGPATWVEDIPLELNRYDYKEEAHFTISYSPVPDPEAANGIGGVVGIVHEISAKIVGDRRVLALRDLASRSAKAKTAEEAGAEAATTLAAYRKDVPFVLVYLLDEKEEVAHLACKAEVENCSTMCPATVDLKDVRAAWPLRETQRRDEIVVVEDLAGKFGRVPAGPWSEPPDKAAVVPIRSQMAHRLAGFLVAGISSRLKFDDDYRGFLELASAQIGTSIANARAYEMERRRNEALAELDRAKTTFFSNISHELRTPLTLITGPIEEMLARPQSIGAADREQLELAHRNALRMLKLVNTLLDFSRIEAGRVEASYEPIDLSSFTAELASVFRSTFERAGLRLTVDCPALSQPVYLDREMWEKIVFNLLSNAFKFTFEGQVVVAIREEGESAEIAVSDTGTGIPAEELPNLF
ncbi:MAG TPA: GAF domain-containing sensor histidine kinase, partial [Bryobacteraceae bacterium]|nr:GAF domain-containing sensor histidine kinase [Bryobacteraceae bacterium]